MCCFLEGRFQGVKLVYKTEKPGCNRPLRQMGMIICTTYDISTTTCAFLLKKN